MRRLRLAIVCAALLLSLLLGLLVSRALESVDAENDLRHEIVAERVFDEMERELTTYLRIEEERPFEHYRYFYIPDEDQHFLETPVLVRSPLADVSLQPFVVGHFQVDSRGSFSTPLVDGELVPKPVRGWGPSESLQRAVSSVRSAVEGRWHGVDLGKASATKSPEPDIRVERINRVVTPGAYLRALNRGAIPRQQRLSQNAFTSVQNMVPPARQLAYEQPRTVEVLLETMLGERVDAERFVLFRRVSVEDEVYRQGVVVELEPLMRWLEERVLTEPDLTRRSRLLLGPVDEVEPTSSYRFRHRFAEPFQDIESVLVLASLSGTRDSIYVYLLSVLLIVTAAAGLFGIYRMVATEVAFAEKRQDFVSAVSHELRTPLTAIRMHAEMLRDGVVIAPEKRQHYYEVMTAESERLTRLVNNVLELSSLDRGGARPQLRAAPIEPVLVQVLETLRPHAQEQGFELTMEVDDALPNLAFDGDDLLQVLFNLVDNAIKYGRGGSSNAILIRALAVDDAIGIEVRDGGPGVDESQLAHVFEPYYRGPGATAFGAKGSGMGLALVARVVERMGGTVRGRNGESGGFTVQLRLPNRDSEN